MKSFIISIICFTYCFSASAQLGYGVRYAGGAYYFNGNTYDNSGSNPYASDKKMSNYVSQSTFFASFTQKKITYRADIGLWLTSNTETADKAPDYYESVARFQAIKSQKDLVYNTRSDYYMGSIGLSAAYHLSEKWRVGAGVNYLFDLGGSSQTTSAVDLKKEVLLRNKFIGIEMPKAVPSVLFNVSYFLKKRLSFSLESQMNIKSLNTNADYYFLIFSLGVNYNFGK